MSGGNKNKQTNQQSDCGNSAALMKFISSLVQAEVSNELTDTVVNMSMDGRTHDVTVEA